MVKIRFKSYDRRVLPEMGAKIIFLPAGSEESTGPAASLLTVPASAVATRDGKAVVYQIQHGRAAEIPVVLGGRAGNQVEIKEGLKAGDKVVASVDQKITPGTRLAVKQN